MTPLRNNFASTEMEIEIDMNNMNNHRNFPLKPKNETPEEKLARRKLERVARTQYKNQKNGNVPTLCRKDTKKFNKIFDKESEFVTELQQILPEVRNPHLHDNEEDKMDNFLIEEESVKKTAKKREKFLAKLKEIQKERDLKQGTNPGEGELTRALTHEELKGRLHSRLEILGQKKNEKKRLRKLKKKELKKLEEEGSDKKKKFISKANPNLKNQGKSESSSVKEEGLLSNADNNQQKTPLRKKPVVKSNGEIVFSKFDFISQDKGQDGGPSAKKAKPTAETLLKNVQKAESKVARLESTGKSLEAASLVETQKWDSALRRAQGEKIRDDTTLLKKTIKKQEKKKQVSKKKWQERTEKVEKQKEVKQDKRKANIQSRKDEKIKKVKKQQRKKGRIA